MKVVVLYHPKSDHGGLVEDYARDYHRFRGHDLELVSLETRDGAGMASRYDVTRYPAVLAIDQNGTLHKLWQEEHLPLMNDLDLYFQE